jgi:LacI family transcriptional regulator
MKTSQVTIKDIARELNISPSTVSRALKDHPDISKETKQAVAALAQKLDYLPNSVALSLRKSKTNTIGVIVPQIVHHFFSSAISGVEDIAYKKGYNVIICQSNESYEREVKDTMALFASRVDGLLVSLSSETKEYDHFRTLHRKGVPLVFFDRTCDELDTSMVMVDDFDGAYQATEHLIQIGCKRIAHLAGPENLSITRKRLGGYIKALEKYNIPIDPSLIVPSGLTIETGYKGAKYLLDYPKEKLPDAIFAVSDPVAIGSLNAIKERGLKVPEDIAIVGFSDEPVTSMIEPALSTIAQPGFEMGQTAVRLFFEQINDNSDSFKPQKKVLKTSLVVRKSSMR